MMQAIHLSYLPFLALVVVSALLATPAQANFNVSQFMPDEGRMRVGFAHIDLQADDHQAMMNGQVQLGQIDAEQQQSPILTLAASWYPGLHLELLLPLAPVELTVNGSNGMIRGLPVATIDAKVTALNLQYFPMAMTDYSHSPFQPYLGLGANFTRFDGVNLDSGTMAALGASRVVGVDVEDSYGVVGQVGMDVELGLGWMFNASIQYLALNLKGDATLDMGVANARAGVDLKVKPQPNLYVAGLTYRF